MSKVRDGFALGSVFASKEYSSTLTNENSAMYLLYTGIGFGHKGNKNAVVAREVLPYLGSISPQCKTAT